MLIRKRRALPVHVAERMHDERQPSFAARLCSGNLKEYSMNDTKGAPNGDLIVAALGELIEALDRRVAHVERLGEARIARETVALRKEATSRIEELTTAASNRDTRERERSDAVMADDGWPLQ
jgi:hypothetical protein